MERSSQAAARLIEIDALQDEVLRQLEELERRTEAVLAEHAPNRPAILSPIETSAPVDPIATETA